MLQFLNYFANYNDYLFMECELPEVFVQTKRMKQTKLSILKHVQYLRARSGNILCLNLATTGF